MFMLPKIHILNSILILLKKKKKITLIINFINTIQKKPFFSIFHFCYIKLLSFACSKSHLLIRIYIYIYIYICICIMFMFMFMFSMSIACELNCPNYKCSIIFLKKI